MEEFLIEEGGEQIFYLKGMTDEKYSETELNSLYVKPRRLLFLMRSQKKEGLDVGALAGLLGAERKQARRVAPQSTGLLGQLLDADRDGDISDDVARIGGGLLSRLFGRKK